MNELTKRMKVSVTTSSGNKYFVVLPGKFPTVYDYDNMDIDTESDKVLAYISQSPFVWAEVTYMSCNGVYLNASNIETVDIDFIDYK